MQTMVVATEQDLRAAYDLYGDAIVCLRGVSALNQTLAESNAAVFHEARELVEEASARWGREPAVFAPVDGAARYLRPGRLVEHGRAGRAIAELHGLRGQLAEALLELGADAPAVLPAPSLFDAEGANSPRARALFAVAIALCWGLGAWVLWGIFAG